MWELDHKESWMPKNWCSWAVVLEKTLESPLDCKEIKAVNPKGDQTWMFFGRTDAEAESPILWPTDSWEKMETVIDFIFLGSKITTDSDCSHEIKICLLHGRKAMTNLDSVLRIRDITLTTNVHLVKAMIFPVVMYGCENWTIKKVECRRTDAFELWCWRRLLRIPWTARRWN